MGLEQIELIMDVEDEFGIKVPDDIAGDVRTVGALHDAVMAIVMNSKTAAIRERADLNEFVWKRLCELSAKLSSGVKARQISRATRFIEDLGYG